MVDSLFNSPRDQAPLQPQTEPDWLSATAVWFGYDDSASPISAKDEDEELDDDDVFDDDEDEDDLEDDDDYFDDDEEDDEFFDDDEDEDDGYFDLDEDD